MPRQIAKFWWLPLIWSASASASAAVIKVGVGDGYDHAKLAAAIAAAQPNDRIEVAAGTYLNDFATVTVPLTIEGVGGVAVLDADAQIPNGKAILITRAAVTIRNLEFRRARVVDGNGAGIRAEAGDLKIENTVFRENQNGILTIGDGDFTVTISNSTFIDNGAGDGQTHAIYVNRMKELSVTGSTFAGTRIGHDIKSRARRTIVTGNTLDDGVSGTTSYAVDLPNGGEGVITGNTIAQGPATDNSAMISYAAEGIAHGVNSLLVTNNTFTNTSPAGAVGVFNHSDIPVTLQNNTYDGVARRLLGPGEFENNRPRELMVLGVLGLVCAGVVAIIVARRRSAAART